MAAVIEDAQRRQRHRRITVAVVVAIACTATAVVLAVVTSDGRGRSAAARPEQQVGQVWVRPDGHLVVVTKAGRVLKAKYCVAGTRGSGQIWITATNGSRTIRLSGTPPHCRA